MTNCQAYSPTIANFFVITSLVCAVASIELGFLSIHFVFTAIVFSPNAAFFGSHTQITHALEQVVAFATPHHNGGSHCRFSTFHHSSFAIAIDVIATIVSSSDSIFFQRTSTIGEINFANFQCVCRCYCTFCNLSVTGNIRSISKHIAISIFSNHLSCQCLQHFSNFFFVTSTNAVGSYVNDGAIFCFLDVYIATQDFILSIMFIDEGCFTAVIFNNEVRFRSSIHTDEAFFGISSNANQFVNDGFFFCFVFPFSSIRNFHVKFVNKSSTIKNIFMVTIPNTAITQNYI